MNVWNQNQVLVDECTVQEQWAKQFAELSKITYNCVFIGYVPILFWIYLYSYK